MKQSIHLILSTLTFGVLCLAALQTAFIALQDISLRHKSLRKITLHLPSLERMEHILFRLILCGFILLTALLTSSILFFYPFGKLFLWHKMLYSCVIWCVFAILLLGRHFKGWRAQTAVLWTVGGVFLLGLVYTGHT